MLSEIALSYVEKCLPKVAEVAAKLLGELSRLIHGMGREREDRKGLPREACD